MNIRDIAREAGVSVATVSRILDPNKQHVVFPETREKVSAVIRKYNYVPNRLARSLSRRSSDTIGMVTPYSTDIVKSSYFQGLIAGIIQGLRPLLYDLKWIMIRNEEADSFDLETIMQKYAVDGLIFLSWRLMPKLVAELQSEPDFPAVLINEFDPSLHANIVYSENKSGIQKGCAYLLSKGYKQIGMLRGPEYVSLDAKERFATFEKFMKENQLPISQQHLFQASDFTEDKGYAVMKQALEKGIQLPRALLCANDHLAYGALRAFREFKISVPEKIAVMGYDDLESNDRQIPPLTSLRQPLEEMSSMAIEILMKQMMDPKLKPVQMKFEPELVLRQSA